ncbi:MAG TPA: hypothetical protein VLK84_28210, partial [Longimicrobium sp.]|nr:hypothetical protein [Longimicrobium sp.]
SGANVRPQYANGWLSFQRGPERRRLSPIPMDWEHADDGQVRQWLHRAEQVEKTTDDDWMAGDLFAEPRYANRAAEAAVQVDAGPAPDEGVDLDPGREDDVKADAPPLPADSAPAAKTTSGPASLIHQSVERIRAMLSDIRSHDR